MDTFGRLPDDVLSTITNLYHEPIISLIRAKTRHGTTFKIMIKYPYVTCQFSLLLDLKYYYDDHSMVLRCNKVQLLKLKEFIDKFMQDKAVFYQISTDDSYLDISINKTIIITNVKFLDACILDIKHKDQLFHVMTEYYNILNAHNQIINKMFI
jgi:hypothetical protein